MAWNDGLYDKGGYQITDVSDDQEVFDNDGKPVGYYNGGVVEEYRGGDTIISPGNDNSKSQPVADGFHNLFGILK